MILRIPVILLPLLPRLGRPHSFTDARGVVGAGPEKSEPYIARKFSAGDGGSAIPARGEVGTREAAGAGRGRGRLLSPVPWESQVNFLGKRKRPRSLLWASGMARARAGRYSGDFPERDHAMALANADYLNCLLQIIILPIGLLYDTT